MYSFFFFLNKKFGILNCGRNRNQSKGKKVQVKIKEEEEEEERKKNATQSLRALYYIFLQEE